MSKRFRNRINVHDFVLNLLKKQLVGIPEHQKKLLDQMCHMGIDHAVGTGDKTVISWPRMEFKDTAHHLFGLGMEPPPPAETEKKIYVCVNGHERKRKPIAGRKKRCKICGAETMLFPEGNREYVMKLWRYSLDRKFMAREPGLPVIRVPQLEFITQPTPTLESVVLTLATQKQLAFILDGKGQCGEFRFGSLDTYMVFMEKFCEHHEPFPYGLIFPGAEIIRS